MGKLLNAAKAHVGATALGVVMLGGGVATAAAVAVEPTSAEGVYEAPAAETSEPAATSQAPAPEPAPAPVVENPAEAPPAATVDTMSEPATEPQPVEAPAPAPSPAAAETTSPPATTWDPAAPFTDAAGLTYQPVAPEPVPLLPGEPGYEPPPAD